MYKAALKTDLCVFVLPTHTPFVYTWSLPEKNTQKSVNCVFVCALVCVCACVCVSAFVCLSPAPSQEEQTQCHVMSHVEAVVHLTTGSLVEETAELQDL